MAAKKIAKKTSKAIVSSARKTARVVKTKLDGGRVQERLARIGRRGAEAARKAPGATRGWLERNRHRFERASRLAQRASGPPRRAAAAIRDRVSRTPWVKTAAKRTADTATTLARKGKEKFESSNVAETVTTAAKKAWHRYPALERVRQELVHAFAMTDGDSPNGMKKAATHRKKTATRKKARKKVSSGKSSSGASKKTVARKKTTARKTTPHKKAG